MNQNQTDRNLLNKNKIIFLKTTYLELVNVWLDSWLNSMFDEKHGKNGGVNISNERRLATAKGPGRTHGLTIDL
uniref:Uncharacterized protein n=1 Tax=Romanomermis culicivorax TaxID=13658 RepID=A0A915KRC7_ROMCU